jgi:hypothetical protein
LKNKPFSGPRRPHALRHPLNTNFYTAVTAGMLQDDGKFRPNDKVTQLLPSFELYDPHVSQELTLRNMGDGAIL